MEEPVTRLARSGDGVALHSGELHKSLGVPDLVLAQLLYIVGLTWVGVAATLGPSHVVFWLLAIVLFYLPSAAVVIHLSRLMPIEGGLYQWAKLGFNEFTGFMVAWNLWVYAIVLNAEVGVQSATFVGYSLGPKGAWLMESHLLMAAASVVVVCVFSFVAILGLNVGKWVQNAGGLIMLVVLAAAIGLPFRNVAIGRMAAYHPLATSIPPLTLFNLNILGKMGFGALGGFEFMAIFAGECRDGGRSIARSVLWATPIIAVLFVFGTSSVLAVVGSERIDLVSPLMQVLTVGSRPEDRGFQLIPLLVLGLLAIRLAQFSLSLAGTARLPLVAGWDNLLPAWFTRLHPTWGTPVQSVLFVGGATLVTGVVAATGVARQEAYQLLNSTASILYALTYLVMFAIPIFGVAGLARRAPLWLRAAAASGFLMTALHVGLSIFPIIDVESRGAFTAKIVVTILLTNMVGAWIFRAFGIQRRPASV